MMKVSDATLDEVRGQDLPNEQTIADVGVRYPTMNMQPYTEGLTGG